MEFLHLREYDDTVIDLDPRRVDIAGHHHESNHPIIAFSQEAGGFHHPAANRFGQLDFNTGPIAAKHFHGNQI